MTTLTDRADSPLPVRSPNQACADVIAQLRARRPEICDGIYRHLRASVPDRTSDSSPEYQDGVRLAVAALLEYVLDGMIAPDVLTAPLPAAAADQARRAARANVSLGVVLRRYVAAHARLGEYVVDAAALCQAGSDGLVRLRRAQERLLEHVAAAVEEEYSTERVDVGRAALVRRLLRGEAASDRDVRELNYKLENRWHIGIVASGTRAERTVSVLANALSGELLTVAGNEDSIWAWLGTAEPVKLGETLCVRN